MQTLRTLKPRRLILALVLALAAATPAWSAPTTIAWAATGTNFETGGNWVGNVTPTSDLTSNVVTFTGATGMVQPSLTQDRSVAGLYIYNPATTMPVFLSGSGVTLSLGASGITQQSPSTGSSYTNTIYANINVATTQSWYINNVLSLRGVLSGTSALSLTRYTLELAGTTANSYNGLVTLNNSNARLYLNKTPGQPALSGDIKVTTGQVTWRASNQLTSTANVTMLAGTLNLYDSVLGTTGIGAETFNSLTMAGGAVYTDGGTGVGGTTSGLITTQTTTVTGGVLNVNGGTQWTMNSLSISNSGRINRTGTAYGTSSSSRILTVGAGGLAITNQATGSYAPIMVGNSLANKATNKLVLQGDVTFTGYAGNANAAYISTDTVNPANPVKGTIELNGTRTFTIHDGDAAVDFRIDPAINDNGATVGALTKAGLGTLALTASNGYTGGTLVSAGTLKAGSANAFGGGGITVGGGVLDLRDFNVGNVITITGTNSSVLLQKTAGALTSNFAAGSNLHGWQREAVGTAIGATTASLLSGTASGAVTSSWTNNAHSDTHVVTDVLDLAGTGAGNLFVLQMSYADDAYNDANATLKYWNGSQWVNAIYGGSFGGAEGSPILGAYDNNLALGNWGRDTVSNTAWAVVDHNSEFAVVVPEPAALSLLALGGLALLRRRRETAGPCGGVTVER